MKKSTLFAILALSGIAAFALADGKLMIGPNSEVVIDQAAVLHDTGVTVSTEASAYPDEVGEAYQDPGTTVPVATIIGSQRSWFHVRRVSRDTRGVVYDVARKRIETVPMDTETVGERRFNPFLIFLAVAVLCMTLSNKLASKGAAAFVAVVAFVVAAFAAMAAGVSIAAFAVVGIAAFAAMAAAFAVTDSNVKSYKVASATFYLMALAAGVLWFLA